MVCVKEKKGRIPTLKRAKEVKGKCCLSRSGITRLGDFKGGPFFRKKDAVR